MTNITKNGGEHSAAHATTEDDSGTSHLRESIAQTRADLGGTIEALHGRLNPAVLKEQALDQFHQAKESVKAELKAELQGAAAAIRAEAKAELADAKSKIQDSLLEAKNAVREATIGKVETMVHNAQDTVRDTGSSLVETIKANPIPAVLAGVGLAWLFMGARSDSTRRTRGMNQMPRPGEIGVFDGSTDRGVVGAAVRHVGDAASSVAHTVQRTAGSVAHGASDLAHGAASTASAATHAVGEKLGQAAHSTQDAAMSLAHGTQDLAAGLAHGAQDQAMRLGRRAETTYHENPLAVGAAVLALGTAVGLAVPITHREEEWMGEVRDQVMGKAQEFAHGALDKVQDAAKHVAEDAARALKENAAARTPGGSPSSHA